MHGSLRFYSPEPWLALCVSAPPPETLCANYGTAYSSSRRPISFSASRIIPCAASLSFSWSSA